MQILLFVLGGLFTIIFALISFLLKDKLDKMDAKIIGFEEDSKVVSKNVNEIANMKINIKSNSDDIKEFHDNYLERFAAITDVINEAKIDVIKEIAKLSNKIK